MIYKSAINKRLEKGVTDGKKMISPLWMSIIFMLIVLLIFAVGSVLFYLWPSGNDWDEIPEKYWQAAYDYQIYTPEEMEESFLKNYSINENNGYKKYEKVDGNIRFTYFVSQEPYDIYHPAFLIYVEYTGGEDTENLSLGFHGEFYTTEGQELGGSGASGGAFSDYVCIVGNSSVDCTFSLDFYLIDPMIEMGIEENQDVTEKNKDAEQDFFEESLDQRKEAAAAYGKLLLDVKAENHEF